MAVATADRTWSLKTHLLRLVLVVALPILGVSIVLVTQLVDQQRDALAASLQETAQALALAVDAEVGEWAAVADTIARSPLIDRADVNGLYLFASRAAAKYSGVRITLIDPSGNQLFTTDRPLGTVLPRISADVDSMAGNATPGDPALLEGERANAELRSIFASGTGHYANLFTRAVDGSMSLSFRAPAIRDGQVRYVVTIAFPVERLNALLGRVSPDEGWFATVVDRRGVVAARNVNAANFVGRSGTPEFLQRIGESEKGVVRTQSLEGKPAIFSFVRSPVSGWTISAGRPLDMMQAPVVRSFWIWAISMACVLGVSALFAWRLWTHVGSPLQALARQAKALERGDEIEMPASRVREVRECGRAWQLAVAAERERRASAMALITEQARRQEAEQASQQKDRLLAALSHELRNPLSAIVTSVHVLRAVSPPEPQTGELLGIVERQSQKLTRMLENLLDLAQLSFDRVVLYKEPVELRALVDSQVDSARAVSSGAPRPPIEVRGGAQWTLAESGRIAQVIAQLIDNALKFTPAGGQVSIELGAVEDDCLMEVRDTGIGMDAATIASLFDPFVQSEQPLDRPRGGLGLGLALVRQVVELHGGTVSAHVPSAGPGVVFAVRLPRCLPPVVAAAGAEAGATEGAVLLVGLSEDECTPLRNAFDDLGQAIALAADAQRAWADLHQLSVQALIVNLDLPQSEAWVLIRTLRAHPAFPALHAWAWTSGDTDDALAARVGQAGFTGLLARSTSPDAVARRVRTQLSTQMSTQLSTQKSTQKSERGSEAGPRGESERAASDSNV